MVSIVTAVRDIARVREVAAVLAKHGFGEVVGRLGLRAKAKTDLETGRGKTSMSVAKRARLVLEDLGPSFVKLGQLASTRPDLLPQDFILELRKLLDAATPVPIEEIRNQVELSLGAEVDAIFESFDDTPLAAASMAQVHRAQLLTNDGLMSVAVKVQRPGIAKTIASDVEILHTLAALLERAIPETRIYSPVGLIRQFDQAITAELDFVSEADNALRFAENFEDNAHIKFPGIYRQASSKQILTLEFLPGYQVNEAIVQGYSGKAIARRAYHAIIQQIYEDGFFHADPHPGNILISGPKDDPILSFVDLGMVGRLGPRMRDLTIDVVTASLRKDYEGIADALYAIGTPTKKVDKNAYRTEVAMLSEKYLGKALKDIEMSSMIRDLVRCATKYNIEIPTDFVMTGKSLMTIEGIGKEIDPDFDVYEESRPLFSDLLRKRYSPEKMGNELLRRIERLGGASYNLPQQLEEVLEDLRLGRLTVRTSDPQATHATERLGRRFLTGSVAASFIVASALLLSAEKDIPAYVLFALGLAALASHTVTELWRSLRRH